MANTPNLSRKTTIVQLFSSSVNTTDTVFPLNGAVPTELGRVTVEIDEGLSVREIIFFNSVGVKL